MSLAFPKAARLTRKGEFACVRRHGTRKVGCLIFTEVIRQGNRPARLGISVSKKYGNAVARNRFKRLVREAFRLQQRDLPLGLMVHVCPRSKAKEASMSQIYQELKELTA